MGVIHSVQVLCNRCYVGVMSVVYIVQVLCNGCDTFCAGVV